MVNFYSYPSIETVENYKEVQHFIRFLKDHDMYDIDFCVTEKIHGSNTGMIYDVETDTVTVQSRNHVLKENEVHYNSKTIANELLPKIREMYNLVQKQFDKPIKQMTVFGEVYGGCYPMLEVEKDPNAIKVQRGVYYSQHNQFRVFDILVSMGGEESTKECSFVPFAGVVEICGKVGMPLVPVLNPVCSLEEALAYPNDGTSVVFAENGLPKPTVTENRMEGVVIKPLFYDVYVGDHRLILKHKNPVFQETCKEKIKKERIDVNGNVSFALAEMIKFVTPERLINVISHYADPPTKRQFSMVMKDYCEDIMAAVDSQTDVFRKLDKEEQKQARKGLNNTVVGMVKNYFYGDGPFREEESEG